MKKLIGVLLLGLLVISTLPLAAQSNYKIARKIAVGGEGGWDYLNVDGKASRIYLSHATTAVVVDIKTGNIIGSIPDTKGIHGIALAQEINRGYTSNGRDSSVTVFDLTTLKTLEIIKITGANPDCIMYDPFSKTIFTFNGRSFNASVIDTKSNKVVATIPLDGKPEFAATDGKGNVFVNIENKIGVIDVINTKDFKVIQHWSIAPGEEPSGLALDNETHRLFSVCSNKLMVVTDALTGKVITTLPIGDRCDGVAFDPEKKLAFSSNGEGTMTVVQEIDANTFKVIATVPTLPGARTIAVDKVTHHLYLPTAEFGAPAQGQNRPAMKPNSFMILDIEPVNQNISQ
jgi:YVTN family beta-propeller protein